MPAELTHFAINADDVPATRVFYETVFGWRFTAWGPPGFFQIQSGSEAEAGSDPASEPNVIGALQQRRELVPGRPTVGLECTFAVDDVDATAASVREAGGRILLERFTIAGVGHLIFFEDPAGNPIGAMQYDSNAE